jgi:50S ribosomal protein L16 3-hydroxylase
MSSRKSHALPSDFWRRFGQENWERKPEVFPAAFPGPLLSPDETMRGLKLAFSRLQAGDPGARPRCYLEGAEVTNGADYARMMPTDADQTLEGYAQRLGSKGFGIVVNAFHVHYPELWYRLRAFFRGLVDSVGLPAGKIDPVFFFGNYPVTPFGVHLDEASVFTFNLAKQKRVLAWPREHFSKRGVPAMDTHLLAPHAPHVGTATQLEMGPADLMYWPSSHWHVGVSEGQLLCTLGVGVYFSSTVDGVIAPAQRLAVRESPRLMPMPTGPFPAELERAVRDAASAATSGSLRREVQAEWMRRVSADGLLPAPPLKPVELNSKDRVQRADGARILHAVLPGGFLFAAEGQSWFLAPREGAVFDASHAAPLVEAFDALNTGEPARVGQLSKKSQHMGAQMQPVLEALAAAGALEKL